MSNLDKMIEWLEIDITIFGSEGFKRGYKQAIKDCLSEAKQIQKEEPKTYTQEEMRIAYNSESNLPFSEWISKYF